MKKLIVASLFISFCLGASEIKKPLPLKDVVHCAVPVDFKKIENGIDQIQNRHTYGVVPGIAGYATEPSGQTLKDNSKDLIDRVSTIAFGRPGVVDVFACKKCFAQWDVTKMSVAVDPNIKKWLSSFLKKDEVEEGYIFVLAHEVGHYIQNLLLKEFFAHPPYLSESQYRLDVTKAFSSGVVYLPIIVSQEHAEVDAIAFVIMERMGLTKSAGIKVLQQIKKEIDEKTSRIKDKHDVHHVGEENARTIMMLLDPRIRLQTALNPDAITPSRCFNQ